MIMHRHAGQAHSKMFILNRKPISLPLDGRLHLFAVGNNEKYVNWCEQQM